MQDGQALRRPVYFVPVARLDASDLLRGRRGLSLKFELAGIEPQDVDILFENGILTIKGERKLGEGGELPPAWSSPVAPMAGAFSPTDADKIEAKSKSGVLVAYLPRKAEAKPKSIRVKVN